MYRCYLTSILAATKNETNYLKNLHHGRNTQTPYSPHCCSNRGHWCIFSTPVKWNWDARRISHSPEWLVWTLHPRDLSETHRGTNPATSRTVPRTRDPRYSCFTRLHWNYVSTPQYRCDRRHYLLQWACIGHGSGSFKRTWADATWMVYPKSWKWDTWMERHSNLCIYSLTTKLSTLQRSPSALPRPWHCLVSICKGRWATKNNSYSQQT